MEIALFISVVVIGGVFGYALWKEVRELFLSGLEAASKIAEEQDKVNKS